MDPRPTLDVVNLNPPKSLLKKRRRALKKAIPRDKEMRKVVSKYRRRQVRYLDSDDDDADPDPYEPSYIFYCLETPPKS
jgi:hypothetical protein